MDSFNSPAQVWPNTGDTRGEHMLRAWPASPDGGRVEYAAYPHAFNRWREKHLGRANGGTGCEASIQALHTPRVRAASLCDALQAEWLHVYVCSMITMDQYHALAAWESQWLGTMAEAPKYHLPIACHHCSAIEMAGSRCLMDADGILSEETFHAGFTHRLRHQSWDDDDVSRSRTT